MCRRCARERRYWRSAKSEISIWHFDGSETYALSGPDSTFFALSGNADEVVVAAGNDLASREMPYRFILELSGGEGGAEVTAMRSIQVVVVDDPAVVDPFTAALALAMFSDEIEEGNFDWFAARNTDNPANDWDDDGILNPYDWTPTTVTITDFFTGVKTEVEVNLTLGGALGTADDPWPIYNVWQLQAIDGMSVSEGGTLSGDFAFFDTTDPLVRLRAQYRLAVDIDATPTKEWKNNAGDTVGFNPIGGEFRGLFDGGGNVVRGLFINVTDSSDAGLFSGIFKNSSGLAVMDLGVEEADIRGGADVGIIAGAVLNSRFSRVWTTGKVVGSGNNVGGVAGRFIDTDSRRRQRRHRRYDELVHCRCERRQ